MLPGKVRSSESVLVHTVGRSSGHGAQMTVRGASADPAVRELTALVEGHPCTCLVAGLGDPLVLVHGLAGSSRWWRRNLPALAARFEVYLVDLPRFGRSRRHPDAFSLRASAGWLHRWMQASGIDAAHLVGHSMGGTICVRLAAQHPETVRRLALVAPAGIGRGRALPGYSLPLLRSGLRASPSFLPLLAGDSARAGPSTLVRAARQLVATDLRPQLANVRAPTLVILGARDPLVPPTVEPLIRKALPSARVITLPAAGHVVMYDLPREFEAALLDFLAAHPRSEGHSTPGAGIDV
jgi:pimeloyl-ACP methyl ester carboxylesterase